MNETMIGIDLASGLDVTAFSANGPHGLRKGDRVKLEGYPHRLRFIADAITSDTQMTLMTYIRPSKGMRKHNRLMKALKRKSPGHF